ncbi:MAG: hypothetical protein ACLP9S_10935 [Syntrophales bacterium]
MIRVLDPCAGTGVAVKKIEDALQAKTCGIEIDQKRGDFAKGVLDRCRALTIPDPK